MAACTRMARGRSLPPTRPLILPLCACSSSRCVSIQLPHQVVTLEERDYADGLFSTQQGNGGAGDVVGNMMAGGGGGGYQGKPGQVAVRMTNLDFASLAAAASQFGQLRVGAGPSIQANTVVLSGAAGLGLEGVGFNALGLGEVLAGGGPGVNPLSVGIGGVGYGGLSGLDAVRT